jgi:hypothetical protein
LLVTLFHHSFLIFCFFLTKFRYVDAHLHELK